MTSTTRIETEDVVERVAAIIKRFGYPPLPTKALHEIAALSATPIERLREENARPVPMVLFCPKCGLQHIDAPDERTPDWANPPHKSHLCHGCGVIWRPADVPTEGVVAIRTRGSKDTIFYNRAALTPSADDDKSA
jgi:hypothetical protein